jgi:hypothetical protein
MSGNKQVIGADGLAGSLKPGADQAIGFIGRRLEWNDVKSAQNGFQLSRQALRPLLRSAIPQLRSDDHTRTHLRLAHLADMLGDAALRAPNEIRDNVGVEQIPH